MSFSRKGGSAAVTYCLFVKHLGNARSHPGDVRVDDVFDIFEHVLN
jgi:hypothetical protein